jgi:hypothetical protein
MKPLDMISVSAFRTRADAQQTKSILDQAGIESVLESDPSIIQWGPTQGKHFAESNATRLMVRPEDVDRATKTLQGAHRHSN